MQPISRRCLVVGLSPQSIVSNALDQTAVGIAGVVGVYYRV